MTVGMSEQLDRIRRAYDLTVEQFERGVDPLTAVPDDLKQTAGFQTFMEEAGRWCNSGAPDIREFLNPRSGMTFLDIGCAASLSSHRLAEWPSTYFGVDISTRLIAAMKRYSADHSVETGGLCVAGAATLPFADGHFDIAAMVGVLEYWSLEYVDTSLRELSRILKSGAKVALDIPNMSHPQVDLMLRLEECLGRPQFEHDRSEFETLLADRFDTERVDTSQVMLRYFCRHRGS